MKVCLLNDCTGVVSARGLCSAHYNRLLRYGTTDGRGTFLGAPLSFLRQAVSHASDDCLVWPFSLCRNGYGVLSIESGTKKRRLLRAHRSVCESVYGPAPTSSHEVAHSCGCRACVNPRHLRWATRAENCSDTIRHGRTVRGAKQPGAVLNEETVRLLRASHANGQCIDHLARSLGIKKSTAWSAIRRHTWAWLDRGVQG